jgi:hypothetical protein
MTDNNTKPYLSIVAASRNDDHGGDPLARTQIFINSFARQCDRHKLHAELILVDWNPVPGRPGLAGVLSLPSESSYCMARVITVPAALHQQFKYADRLHFFQMIAKNVGIRRARGEFILATNIDIIFSDELVRYLSSRQLDPGHMYRVDRYDIQSGLTPSTPLDQTLEYAWNNPVRSNRRQGLRPLIEQLYGDEVFLRHCVPKLHLSAGLAGCSLTQDHGVWAVRLNRDNPLENLHTNACGDFTLLSRQGWEQMTGYPEFEAFSFNIDSVGVAAAHYAGLTEVALLPPCVCFHIEHSLGSGWTPEGEKKLFDRLNQKEILNPEWHILTPLLEGMRKGVKPTALNGPSWGMAEFELPEELLPKGAATPTPIHPRPYVTPSRLAVSALLPEFDLDRLSLWQDRKNNPTERLNLIIEETRANLRQAEQYMKEIEKDRTNQMVALNEYATNMKKVEEYIRSVEKDREDRLASIHFYQEKLKQAYADHDHNVAYIGRIHEELAAHIKVIAGKDAIIAELNERLRVALEQSQVRS